MIFKKKPMLAKEVNEDQNAESQEYTDTKSW